MADLPVITISREYAAYGRTIAGKLAKELDLPWYDRDFVKKTAEESGYAVEDIKRDGEEMSKGSSLLDKFLGSATGAYSSSYDGIFYAQSKTIVELSKSPCIIIGRCADHVLKEAGIPSFNVFLYGSLEDRIRHAKELGEAGEADLAKYIEKRDSKRRIYYKQYNGHEMGDCKNYNLCIDTGRLGVDKSVKLILDAIN